jgi:hypothetical protein
MPSIIHESPGLVQRGVALLSQSVARQPTGLVNVSISYVVAREQEQRVLQNFVVDSQPPIFPDIISRDELQTRQLYMQHFTSSRVNGVMTIQAQYAGGLQRGLQTPYITNAFETKNIRLFVGAVYIGFRAMTTAEGFQTGAITRLFSDIYNIQARSRIADFSACVVGDATFDVDPPKVTNLNNQDGLISAASLNIQRQTPTSRTITLASPSFRGTPALELLEIVARAEELGGVRSGRLSVESEDRIDNVTPTVRVLHRKFRVIVQNEVFGEPIDQRSDSFISNAIYVRFSPRTLPG